MTIREELTQSLTSAMKEKNDLAKKTIRGILSNIKNQEIEKQTVLSEEEIIAVLYKELKIRDEAIEGAEKINRTDLIDEAEREKEIIKNYLPKEMEESEIRQIVQNAIKQIDAKSMADMGKVMKIVLPELAGKAPNSLISKIVKDELSS
ncbi:MAG: glutamyl-tRNA amidotransferase [Anaerolineaceae bacterium]|nr:glutamyl-tRNA amidotransferase [Anaerolineaceae bacterium]